MVVFANQSETNTSALRGDMETKAGIKSLPLLSLKTSMLTPYIENISCWYKLVSCFGDFKAFVTADDCLGVTETSDGVARRCRHY